VVMCFNKHSELNPNKYETIIGIARFYFAQQTKMVQIRIGTAKSFNVRWVVLVLLLLLRLISE